MAEHRDFSTVFERLMRLNRETFKVGHYSTSYHALAAALHEAQEQQEVQDLSKVHQVAEEQLVWIDREAPAYEHSTTSAALRGHTSTFALLAQQANARYHMLQEERRREVRLPLNADDEDGSPS